MERCPRCGHPADHPIGRLLALSRLDNKTKVCEYCGMDEALIAAGRPKDPSRPLTFDWKKKMEGGTHASGLYF